MSNIPRILPLVGVAIGGVIAANALSGAHAIPQLLSATQAMAAQALAQKPAAPAAATPGANATAAVANGQSAVLKLPPACAPSAADLAKAAGLSPAELQVLQSLQSRSSQIDDRAKDLDTEVQLLNAAEVKLDAKLKAMNGLKADIQALMGQADQKTQADVDRLVVVYSKMKPQDAAAVMAQLDDKVRLPIAAAMKPQVLSAILGKMGTMDAKVLTEKLANRFAAVQALAQAANAPAAAGASAPSAASGAASPVPTAPYPATAGASAPSPKPSAQAAATAHPKVSRGKAHGPKRRRWAKAAVKKKPAAASAAAANGAASSANQPSG